MNQSAGEFNRAAVQPIVCLKQGWELIKDQYWLFLGMAFVGLFIGGMVPFGILLGPMMCGLHFALIKRSRGERVEFNDLMKGFDFFGPSLIATLIQVIPMIIIITPIYLIGTFGVLAAQSGASRPEDILPMLLVFGVMFLIIIVISFVFGMFFVFTYPLIVDRQLSGVDAVKMSARAALANFPGVFGLMLLSFVMGFAGLLLCYVGAFFVMPLGLAAWHVAYKQVFGLGAIQVPNLPPPPPTFT